MNDELLTLLTNFNQNSIVSVQHYKNKKIYSVITVGEHTTTHQRFVAYTSISYPQDNTVWIRPIEEFCEILNINEQQVPRFQLVNNKIDE